MDFTLLPSIFETLRLSPPSEADPARGADSFLRALSSLSARCARPVDWDLIRLNWLCR